ncbi:MAG: isoprenylcysteine carboxylmethyltransferase family protein [Leptolinea sp.]|jgi:protein-S-isoprenylcysteine O-methyltransferase Ste14|nr:isoprenylcysteine carboxylmethyltransferase family protein [Leptolinea sp.]
MKYFVRWTRKEYSLPVRLLATACAGLLFAFLIPLTLIKFLPRVDTALGIPPLTFGYVNLLIGGICMLIGLVFGFWSIGDQLFDARGTPIPVLATQKLLVRGPFKYCRNPMSFGTFMAYFGLSICVGSVSSFVGVAVFAVLLMLYIKKFEERELEARFGEEYKEYKTKTPFIIPRIF